MGYHHHNFGHHHHFGHHGFGHRHHHHHGLGLGAMAAGTVAGVAAGALAGSVLARPSRTRPMEFTPTAVVAPSLMFAAPTAVVASSPLAYNLPAVSEPVALGVASVQLPFGAIQKDVWGVSFFAIDVFPQNGEASWRVLRRYSQFHELAEKLNAYRNIHVPFPRKHLTGCSGRKLESRRRQLETWLSSVVVACPSVPAWTSFLKNFLGVPLDEVSMQPTVAHSPIAPQASVLPPLPPLPPPAEEPPESIQNLESQGGSGSEGMLMDIIVPSGVSPGQVLNVSVPSGKQILLEIPPGVVDGMVLQVWYDPAQGSLQPLM